MERLRAEIVGVIHDCESVLVIFRKINDILYLSLSVSSPFIRTDKTNHCLGIYD